MDRFQTKLTSSIMIILMSLSMISMTFVSSQYVTEDEPTNIAELNDVFLSSDNYFPDLTSTELSITDGAKKRIVLYETFDAQRLAIEGLSSFSIDYIYASIPAIVLVSEPGEIPLSGVESVIDDRRTIHTSIIKDITDISGDYNANTLNEVANIIGISDLHTKYGLTGEGVTIAIIDTGIGPDLEAFNNENGVSRITYDVVTALANKSVYDQDGHGSHVAGIAAANGKYFLDGEIIDTSSTGMAPGVSILSIRALDENGYGDNSWILEGIDKAIQANVDIISMSLGSHLYLGEQDLFRVMLLEAEDKGIVVVAAAGNRGPYGASLDIPGGLESVIGVGAAYMTNNEIDSVWRFTALGPSVNDYTGPDIVAPGNTILSVNGTNGGLASETGTSMSTPQISGGIALLKEAFPNANLYQIREAIFSSGGDLYEPVEAQGRGLVDFSIAYDALADILENSTTRYISSTPNKFSDNNYYFGNQLQGITKTFDFFLYSSSNTTVSTVIDPDYTWGVQIGIDSSLDVKVGLNRFEVNFTVINPNIARNHGRIYFTDGGEILQEANITYSSVTRFLQSKILFDTSHDNDTPSGYFTSNGPRGQFSKLSKVLEERGHLIDEHRTGELTSLILEFYDILVIADPEISYTSQEIQVIHKFINDDGKSLLIIVNGGFMRAEEYEYTTTNIATLNEILQGTGISIDTDEISINHCTTNNIDDRIASCPRDAVTSSLQDILPPSTYFASFGPELLLSDDDADSNIVHEIGYQNNKAVIMASELKSEGRVMVFSSQLLFDNIGQIRDYVGRGSDVNNRQIARDAIDYLIEPRSVKVDYSVNSVSVGAEKVDLKMHEIYYIEFVARNSEGELLNLGESINVSVYQDFQYSYNFTFTKTDSGSYAINLKFTIYGYYNFYLPVPYSGDISSDGYFSIFVNLNNFDDIDNFGKISAVMMILISLSWILWLTNEGGRLYNSKKAKKEE